VIAPPDVLAVLLDALADRIAARIGVRAERDTYSSRDLPPRCSRRRFAELCRSGRVADARREGREWMCSRDAWLDARAHRSSPSPAEAPTRIPPTIDAQANALLARAGLRVVGR